MTKDELAGQCPRVTGCSRVGEDAELMWVKDPPVRYRRTEATLGYSLFCIAFCSCILAIQTPFALGLSLRSLVQTVLLLVVVAVCARYGLPLIDGRLQIIEHKDTKDIPEK